MIKKSTEFSTEEMLFSMRQNQREVITLALARQKIESQPFVEIECLENEKNKESEVTERQLLSRERKNPDRYGEWVYLAHEVDDPATVKEALSSTDKNEWVRTMENEINSLHKNDVWDLMELPEGRKAVGSKWGFKRKHDVKPAGN